MLIQGLCNYYDILAEAEKGNILPIGYSSVKIHYKIALTEDGKIERIINCQKEEDIIIKEKVKKRFVPIDCIMPQRTEKPGIDSNIIEHRPLYLFGLNLDKDVLTPIDKTQKAKKSHETFVTTNLEFIEGMDSPLIRAYRNFLLSWKPEEEIENKELLKLGKDYAKSGFAFCLDGYSDMLLHDEKSIKQKWNHYVQELGNQDGEGVSAQCAVSGEIAQIARIHNKIKGVAGGLATGTVLVSFKNPSETSYGKEQSYNSNISESIMKKYTEMLNYLIADKKHRILLDDTTIIFWSMDSSGANEDLFEAALNGESEGIDVEETDELLQSVLQAGKEGLITNEKIKELEKIKPEVDFYIVGLKPNSSRLAVKFIYRKRYAEIIWNLVKFQQDLQIVGRTRSIPLWRIKKELISPKTKNATVNPELMVKLMESAIYGRDYPTMLLETVIRRVRIDEDENANDAKKKYSSSTKINAVRAGIIKACLNRNYLKEELKVALDKENFSQAYLYGRLFAVLERLQQDAASGDNYQKYTSEDVVNLGKPSLNRTINDSYFDSASTKPILAFPKLIRLAQKHLGKSKNMIYFNKLIGEIMSHMDGEFKEILSLKEQGEFMIGYYHQYQSFFEKKEKNNKEEN